MNLPYKVGDFSLYEEMKTKALLFLLVVQVCIAGCGNNEIQIPNQRLVGTVSGEEWNYKSANAFLFSSDFKYEIKFLSTNESAEDPCAVPSPGSPYVSIVLSPVIGSYSLPLPNLQESARFHESVGLGVIATSGFLEIFDVNGGRIFGYMQAVLDDDNTVEGSFEAIICN